MNHFLSGKKVLVTGANGFVGAWLAHRLEQVEADVIGLVRPSSDLFRLKVLKSKASLISADLRDFEHIRNMVSDIKPNYVFSTATSRSREAWLATVEVNTSALLNLLNSSLSDAFQGFIHCGSSLEYGEISVPFREVDTVAPNSLFGAAKAAGTMLLQGVAKSQNLPISILRLFHVYGFMEPHHRLIPTVIRKIHNAKPVLLTEPGFGHDFVFVDDVVQACLLAAEKDLAAGEILNVASGNMTVNEDVVEMIGTLMNQAPIVETGAFPSREWDKHQWFGDHHQAKQRLGWTPATPFIEGLKKTIAWYEAYGC